MDKETLSNYGWIVICVLVLAVMIALASPFGTYVSDAVKSTTQGLFDVQQGALSVAGIDIADQSFEGGSGSTTPDPALNPDNGTEPQAGDMYTYGDYEYCYGYDWCGCGAWSNICGCERTIDGWGVRVLDKTKTEYGAILETINGQPITNLNYTFYECTALKTAPAIPNSVTDMYCTFAYCTSLETAPVIPNSVKYMDQTFEDCTFLTAAPVIPNSVTDMNYTFQRCTSLTTAPTIPSSVKYMEGTFAFCTSLKTYVGSTDADGNFSNYVIPSSVTNMQGTFYECTDLTDTISIPCRFENRDLCWYNYPATIEYYHFDGCGH